jgi:carbon-monoxide dehydrogenase medium subunit
VRGSFEYVRVQTVAEATAALAETSDAAVLAGGTDLLVDARSGVRAPSLLVDIKRIEELKVLELASEVVSIGAAVPLNRLVENAPLRDRLPGLAEAAASIATYQLRNRATLVGNVCNASPAADMAPILLALGARVVAVGPSNERRIPLVDFFTGVKRTALTQGEVVTRVEIPIAPSVRTAALKQQRIRGHDLAVVNVAGAYRPETDQVTLAVGSCAPTPRLLEPMPVGKSTAADLAQAALDGAEGTIRPIDDVRASAAYRSAVLPVLLRRLIERLLGARGGA